MAGRERETISEEIAEQVEKVLFAIKVNDSIREMFRCFERLGARLTSEGEEQIVGMLLRPFSNGQLGGVIIDLAWIKTIEDAGETNRSTFLVSNEIARRKNDKRLLELERIKKG